MLVADTCSPRYSRGRDQEDHDSKPARANSSGDPISKNSITKKGWWNAQGVGPEFQTQYQKEK
jgi:hypothetical protein